MSFTGQFVFGAILGYVIIMPASVRALLLASRFLGMPLKFDFAEFFHLLLAGFFCPASCLHSQFSLFCWLKQGV